MVQIQPISHGRYIAIRLTGEGHPDDFTQVGRVLNAASASHHALRVRLTLDRYQGPWQPGLRQLLEHPPCRCSIECLALDLDDADEDVIGWVRPLLPKGCAERFGAGEGDAAWDWLHQVPLPPSMTTPSAVTSSG